MNANDNHSVICVAGGSGSLGYAIARKFVSEGFQVALSGYSSEKLKLAAEKLRSEFTGSRILAISCDVTNESDVIDLFNAIEEQTGKSICTLVNAVAAPATLSSVTNLDFREWKKMIDIDLNGAFLLSKYAVPPMINAGFGRVIHFTSFHNIGTYPHRVPYNAAKGGVEGLVRSLAVELGHNGITVNAVAPGPIMTERTKWFLEQDPKNEKGMLSRTPNCRLGTPEEVADTVFFLSSNSAGHINGQQIVIDGGWSKNTWWGSHEDL